MERPDVYIAVRQVTLHWRNTKGQWRQRRRERLRTRSRSGPVVIGASRLRLAVATSSGLRPDDSRNRRTAQDDPE